MLFITVFAQVVVFRVSFTKFCGKFLESISDRYHHSHGVGLIRVSVHTDVLNKRMGFQL